MKNDRTENRHTLRTIGQRRGTKFDNIQWTLPEHPAKKLNFPLREPAPPPPLNNVEAKNASRGFPKIFFRPRVHTVINIVQGGGGARGGPKSGS